MGEAHNEELHPRDIYGRFTTLGAREVEGGTRALSPRWCGRDDAHSEHERRNEFGGTDYCTGMSEEAAERGRHADSTASRRELEDGFRNAPLEWVEVAANVLRERQNDDPDDMDLYREEAREVIQALAPYIEAEIDGARRAGLEEGRRAR